MSSEAQAVIDNMSRLEINSTGTTTRAKLRRSLFAADTEGAAAALGAAAVLGQHARTSWEHATDPQV